MLEEHDQRNPSQNIQIQNVEKTITNETHHVSLAEENKDTIDIFLQTKNLHKT